MIYLVLPFALVVASAAVSLCWVLLETWAGEADQTPPPPRARVKLDPDPFATPVNAERTRLEDWDRAKGVDLAVPSAEYPYGWPCPVCGDGLSYITLGLLDPGGMQHVCGPCFRQGKLRDAPRYESDETARNYATSRANKPQT